MDKPINIFILGSCVSRDPFEIDKSGLFKINAYFARSSFASLDSSPFLDEEIIKNIDSNWQKKVVKSDMEKSIFREIRETDFDILLIDFIDERFNISKYNNSIHTVSSEYKKALYEGHPYRLIGRNSPEKKSHLKNGLKKFIDFLILEKIDHKVVINKVYWTDKVGKEKTPNKTYKKEEIDSFNLTLDMIYNELRAYLPNAKYIEYDDEIIYSDPEHKWGLEPFHFNHDMFSWQNLSLVEIKKQMEERDTLDYIEDSSGRRMYYKLTPAKLPSESPLLVILHGHTYNVKPSSFNDENWNVLAPIDNFGVNNCGSWWLGENGDFFVMDLLHTLIRKTQSELGTSKGLFFWGSSMGGFGALLHGCILGAKAIYANIPQIHLLKSTYSEKGMKRFFEPIFAKDDRDGRNIYNDITNFIKKENPNENPLFFISQSRYDYERYLEEQSLYFFKKCLDFKANIHYEVFPVKGHKLIMPIHDAVDKMLKITKETEKVNNLTHEEKLKNKDKIGLEENKTLNSIIYGLMNFSVIHANTKAYKAASKEYLEYKKTILNDDRLKVREKIFFKHTIPLIINQHKKYLSKGILLRFNIAISNLLPLNLIERFNHLKKHHSEIFNIITVSEHKTHNWNEILDEDLESVFKKHTFKEDAIILSNFRLDDDDILSSTYFDLLEEYLLNEYEGFYLTFPKGYVGIYEENYNGFFEITKPYLAIGLAKICLYSKSKRKFLTENPIVLSTAHTLIVNNSKTILDSRAHTYIWTMHNFSDTRSNDVTPQQSRNKIMRFIEDNKLSQVSFDDVKNAFKSI